MMEYTQENRFISIHTPLGEDAVLLQGFTGQEGISRLFSFDVHLLSVNKSISFDKIIGQNVTIAITLPDGDEKRYINGFISRFAQSGDHGRLASYRAEIVPWLWFLTRTTDCRIFQNMTVPDIIIKIFKDLGFTDFKNLLPGGFEPREYCVQYRETDFNFVSRLMEQYGIFYFFEHEEKKHTLVLANSPNGHRPCPGQEQARCTQMGGSVEEEDVVTSWYMEQELRPGKYALTDYNFETPSTSLAVNVSTSMGVGGNGKYEVYEYPGEYLMKGQGERLVKLRMEEEEAFYVVARGASTCRAFTPGYRFDLVGHSSPKMDKRYVLTEVRHVASIGESYVRGGGVDGTGGYSNQFTCIPHDVPYRPQRVTPRPIVQGPQTAIVVGPGNEEIHTDKYGRVKVRFHWDREKKRDEDRSCWIRVSHPWAGNRWGAVSIPRIEQEVIVDFLEGDPDQPIITGRVYNAEQMPPYQLPANQTQSGVKSRSSKGGDAENFNEIRFEDKKGDEELYIHAEKDENIVVEHDQGIAVGNDRAESIKRDRRLDVGRDKSETVSRNKAIHVGAVHNERVDSDMYVNVGANLTETVAINYAEIVGAAMELTVGGLIAITVGAGMTETVGGAKVETIGLAKSENIGGNNSLTVGKDLHENIGEDRVTKVVKDLKESIGGQHKESTEKEYILNAKKIQLIAEEEINIKAGKAELIMKKNGDIMIKGNRVNIKGNGDVIIKGSNIKEN